METNENVYTLKEKLLEIQAILESKPASFFEDEPEDPRMIKEKLKIRYLGHGFGAKYYDAVLNENQKEIYRKIWQDKKSFFLAGAYGVGKSALLNYLGQKIITKYRMPSILYTTSQRVIDSIKNNDPSIKVQFLFIDDFGHENFGLDNLNYFTDFMKNRYSNKAFTFIGSNFKIADIAQRNEYYRQITELLSDKSFMNYYELKGENLRK